MSKASDYRDARRRFSNDTRPAPFIKSAAGGKVTRVASVTNHGCMHIEKTDRLHPYDALRLAEWIMDIFGEEK